MALFKRTVRRTSATQVDISKLLDSMIDGDYTDWGSISSLKNSDIFTAISMISSDIASTDILERVSNQKNEASKIAYLFNQNPTSGEISGRDFKQLIVANLLINGESFVFISRDELGEPDGFQFLTNDTIALKWDEENAKLRYFQSMGDKLEIKNEDILHFRYFSLDGSSAISPLYALVSEIGISQGSKRFLKNFFDRGATPNTIVKYEQSYLDNFSDGIMDEDEIEEAEKDAVNSLTKRIQNAFYKNSGGVLPLDDTVTIEQLKVPTEVLQFLNSYTFSSQQIAKAFRIPAQLLGNEQANSGLSDLLNQYLTTCLSPLFAILTSEMELKLASNTEAQYEFNADKFIDNDPVKRMESTIKLLQGSVITIPEARTRLGLPKKFDDTQLLASLNYTPLSNLADLQMAKIKNTGTKPLDTKGGEEDG